MTLINFWSLSDSQWKNFRAPKQSRYQLPLICLQFQCSHSMTIPVNRHILNLMVYGQVSTTKAIFLWKEKTEQVISLDQPEKIIVTNMHDCVSFIEVSSTTRFLSLYAALQKNVATRLCTSWALSTYSFPYFKSRSSSTEKGVTVVWPDEVCRVILMFNGETPFSFEKLPFNFRTILKFQFFILFK